MSLALRNGKQNINSALESDGVLDFNIDEWNIEESTFTKIQNNPGKYSAAWVIQYSLDLQYLTADNTINQGSFRGSLNIVKYIKTIVQQLDNVTPSGAKAHSKLDVAKAVSNLTSGSYNIVVVSSFSIRTSMSRHSAPIAKMNLYLFFG